MARAEAVIVATSPYAVLCPVATVLVTAPLVPGPALGRHAPSEVTP